MKLPYCYFLHTVAMSLYHFHEYVFRVKLCEILLHNFFACIKAELGT